MHVALYARVSTTRQADNDLSIPDQLRQLNEWCRANGHLQHATELLAHADSRTTERVYRRKAVVVRPMQ
jgi:DNA invertase Pin-like site-specific DNA recombinase